VRSAYRSPSSLAMAGVPTRSEHMDGRSFGIAMSTHYPAAFEPAARAVGFLGFGFYPAPSSCTSTLAPPAPGARRFRWAVPFAAETPPTHKVLAQSRRLKGTGTAGVPTIGAVGVEIAQEVLA
jgi:zinc D-Ala-D-Ala carboxypeptidase